jgi:hypothetical protein
LVVLGLLLLALLAQVHGLSHQQVEYELVGAGAGAGAGD